MIKSILIIILSLYLGGCGLLSSKPREANKNYEKFVEAQKAVALAQQETHKATPSFEITLPAPDGKEYKIKHYDKLEPIEVAQIKDSEWARSLEKGIGGATIVGGIYAGTGMAETIFGAIGSTYTAGGGIKNVGNKFISTGEGGVVGEENNPTAFIMAE